MIVGCYTPAMFKRRDLLMCSPFLLAACASYPARAEAPAAAHSAEAFYNVRSFGALGDGRAVDSSAINKAIEAVAAAGGGTLYFPAGTYMCFSIRLKSSVHLYLDQGCVILAADSPKKGDSTGYNGGVYDTAEADTEWVRYQDYGHNHWKNSLIHAIDQHDFSITGPGLIFGKGLSNGFSHG